MRLVRLPRRVCFESGTAGVVDVSVNLATGKATIRYTAGTVSLLALKDAVRAAGYEPSVATVSHGRDAPPGRPAGLRIWRRCR